MFQSSPDPEAGRNRVLQRCGACYLVGSNPRPTRRPGATPMALYNKLYAQKVPILARPGGRAQPVGPFPPIHLSLRFQSSPDPEAGRNPRHCRPFCGAGSWACLRGSPGSWFGTGHEMGPGQPKSRCLREDLGCANLTGFGAELRVRARVFRRSGGPRRRCSCPGRSSPRPRRGGRGGGRSSSCPARR